MRRGREQRDSCRLLAFSVFLCVAGACTGPAPQPEPELYQEAELAFKRGDLESSLERAQTRASALAGESDSHWLWSYRILAGEILITQGRPMEALQVLGPSLPSNPELTTLGARWKVARASGLMSTGNIDDADALLRSAEAQAIGSHQTGLLPKLKSIRAQLFFALNREEDFERELRSALELAIEEKDPYYQAAALNNLGRNLIRKSRYGDAISLLEQALDTAERAGAARIASAATTNLGICANNLGDFDAALAYYQKAIETQRQQGSKPFLQASLGEMGNIHMRQNQPQKSIPYYQEALALAKEVNSQSDASKWAGNLAAAFILLNNWEQAETYNTQAIALKESAGDEASLIYSRLNSAAIAAGRNQYQQADSLYNEAIRAPTNDPSVLWEAHAGLARMLRSRGQDAQAQSHFETAIGYVEEFRSELGDSSYKITFLARLIQFYQDYVDALVDQGNFDAALRVVESSRARVLSERLARTSTTPGASPDIAHYQQLARQSGAVLLSYWLAPKRSFLWVITPNKREFFELPPQQTIASWVESQQTFILNLRDPMNAGPIASDRLYEALLAPARPLIPPGSRVIVVPDGALHSLNFETLPVPGETRRYWIEDVTVSVATSLNGRFDLVNRRPDSLLLIGDADPGVAEFQRLPSAAREIRSIEDRMRPIMKTVHQGEDARPSVYRSSHPENFSIIHFAAHATANRESPLDSAIILSRESDTLSPYKLYARDLIDLPLNAELVTISGCRSAGARIYSGEGLVGFTWAFLQAGARRVIAGLWDVSDASTADLMDQLYKGIQAGQTPENALRAAKLAWIHSTENTRKPYYWAPFQVYTR